MCHVQLGLFDVIFLALALCGRQGTPRCITVRDVSWRQTHVRLKKVFDNTRSETLPSIYSLRLVYTPFAIRSSIDDYLLVMPVILYHKSVFYTQPYPRHLQYTPDPKSHKKGRARADPTLLLLTPIRGPLMRPIYIFQLPPDTPHLPLRDWKGPRWPSLGEIFMSTTIHTL